MIEDNELNKKIDERFNILIKGYNKTAAFTDRKLTDTPTDSNAVVPRKFVTMNGTVTNRPSSVVAIIGQPYLATDTNIPMTYTSNGWVNGSGSIVASA